MWQVVDTLKLVLVIRNILVKHQKHAVVKKNHYVVIPVCPQKTNLQNAGAPSGLSRTSGGL